MWLVAGLDCDWPYCGEPYTSERALFAGRSLKGYACSLGKACAGARSAIG